MKKKKEVIFNQIIFAIQDNAPENNTRYRLLTDQEWVIFDLSEALSKMKVQKCPIPLTQPQPAPEEDNK